MIVYHLSPSHHQEKVVQKNLGLWNLTWWTIFFFQEKHKIETGLGTKTHMWHALSKGDHSINARQTEIKKITANWKFKREVSHLCFNSTTHVTTVSCPLKTGDAWPCQSHQFERWHSPIPPHSSKWCNSWLIVHCQLTDLAVVFKDLLPSGRHKAREEYV